MDFEAQLSAYLAGKAQSLEEAKAAAQEKGYEPFDIEVFEKCYMPSGPPPSAELRPLWIAEHEFAYYVWSGAKTIAKYAKFVELNDLYDGG